MPAHFTQLISYIAPSAPATRRPASGNEPYLRPEIGFTPQWYHNALGIDFGENWHINPAYRKETILFMREEIKKRFPDSGIGGARRSILDLLTGVFGACTIAGIYSIPIRFYKNNWPICEKSNWDENKIDTLQPPDLSTNTFFNELLSQLDWIADHEGEIEGYINWQGILNNAHRIRGENLFYDLIEHPDRCLHLFNCVCTTMTDAAKIIHDRQQLSGVDIRFFTVSNCLVNMISPSHYHDLLLSFDKKISEAFGCIGIHNCAWNATPYMQHYAEVPNLAYIDMGMVSDLAAAKELFPTARRAIMYTPMDLANKSTAAIRTDLETIARDYGPCDVVFADIEDGTPDWRIHFIIEECGRISTEYQSTI